MDCLFRPNVDPQAFAAVRIGISFERPVPRIAFAAADTDICIAVLLPMVDCKYRLTPAVVVNLHRTIAIDRSENLVAKVIDVTGSAGDASTIACGVVVRPELDIAGRDIGSRLDWA